MFRFEKLEVWKKASVVTEDLFDLSEILDEKRKYRWAEQLRSAAMSITNNIAEGSGSTSKHEFRQFLNFSHRSVSETANIIIICHRRNYITDQQRLDFLNNLEEVSRMIMGFSKSL
ncbi:MAG: four helix bundle protein [Ignavibacteriae bacterium]|nr:four helix bundle protein [Ignavibacteriota bacterium]